MNRFLNSVLIGVGIGLLIAPMPGRDMRKVVRSRLEQFWGSLQQNRQMDMYSSGQEHPSATKSALDQTAETSMNVKSGDTLAAKTPGSYTPSYPEYVNPERSKKSNQ